MKICIKQSLLSPASSSLLLYAFCHVLYNSGKIGEAAMSDKYLDNYLSVVAIDVAVEEKTRIAKMAVATLHKLHNVMGQMRDWREDSAKLKSNIWRMKMALRADDKNGNDNQQIDPLIVHQRAEISRLEQANDALENEVTSLKSALTKAEEDVARITVCEIGDKIATLESEFSSERERMSDEISRLKKRLSETEGDETSVIALKRLRDELNEFARGDRTIEIIFANAIGKTVEMIIGLSEELVNVSENLYRFKTRNRSLRLKLDRLRAMLRSRCGSSAEYRKRIGELNNLAEQLRGEMGRLKVIRENASHSGSSDATGIPDVVRRVDRLMNDLRNNLKSDREAMIAAGDPDCLKYMKKVVNLKVNLKVLSVELRQSNVPLDKRLREGVQHEKCLETASSLNDFLREIDNEIGKLKIKPMDEHCKIGGVSGKRYMTKVAELEDIVGKSIAVIAVLKRAPPEIVNTDERITKTLEDVIERLCCKMKELEVFDDRGNLRERIEQLEASIVYLKSELLERNERVNALNDERAGVRLTLERDRERYEGIIADVRQVNEALRGEIRRGKQEISELSLGRDHSERRVAEMRLQMKVEIDAARKELQELRDDKGTLLREVERLCNVLGERDGEIGSITSQGDALRAEMEELRTKLGLASDENVKLRSIIEGLGEREEARERPGKLKSSAENESGGDGRDNGVLDRARNLRDESEHLKAKSNEPEISSDKAERVDCLKSRAPDVGDGVAGRVDEISDLVPDDERSLTYRSNVRTCAGEETSRGEQFDAVTAEEYRAASEGNQVEQLRNEKEQLEKELLELRSEKGFLARSTADANNKCAALQDQVNKFKSERDGLREGISERAAAAAESLKLELARARAELEDAAVDAARLRAEYTRAVGDLDALSLRNTEAEDRVRVLLTEKNELATRINELNDENVALREQLNKAREENEYFSMELNKSRVENDKAKVENALLQATCDARGRELAELTRERDDARGRINEIGNECRALGNQLRIQRMKYEALRLAAAELRDENNDREDHSKEIDTRRSPARVRDPRERGFAAGARAAGEIKRKRDCTADTARTGAKAREIGERRDGGAEVKVESDTRVGRDNKAGLKDEPKGEPKRPRSGNKALKLERANTRSENSGLTPTGLVQGRSESPATRGARVPNGAEAIVGSFLKKFEIASNRLHEEGISNYSEYSDDPDTSVGNGRTAALDIDRRREIENQARRMKENIPRSGRDSRPADGEETEADFGGAMAEIQALKHELMNLRDEKTALRSHLEIFKEELNVLKSERVALKDELAVSRKSNNDLRLKVNDLRGANEKLKETNAGLGARSRDASRETNECTTVLDERLNDNFEHALSDYLKRCSFAERNSRVNRRNRFDRVSPKNPGLQSVEENLRHIEGQKSRDL
ncbi:PREDICTED: CAP-Gly domain-containing linker protein 1-like [Wasmannia auropunctata]|uniref:CAP-Gly domain-containing linker protein 1-like n=1 Tax=Wasmannia auropunctata TaxID=64793 RepID=UPI0005EFC65E|nr:PREDICTED: CAP-Gly domain-containing linker protein 1-like [Wasmannia auropunctata]